MCFASTGWQFGCIWCCSSLIHVPWWCGGTKRQAPLSPLPDRLFWTDGWMIQGRDIWKNWSWQHFITLGSQKGLAVINPCWESNLDSLSLCVQVCVHSARLQLLFWVTVLCELCYNLQKMTKVHDCMSVKALVDFLLMWIQDDIIQCTGVVIATLV